jgi:hypothetical protein
MGDFAISKTEATFATLFGIGLWLMNFAVMGFASEITAWYQYVIIAVFGSLYIFFIYSAIIEPTSKLIPIKQEELEDHEYKRITIID